VKTKKRPSPDSPARSKTPNARKDLTDVIITDNGPERIE
jgi:hypothetical protein